jgi:MFS superfamily sulfate permease-like transporter
MLAGIGVLIVLQQFHVMLDNSPKRNGPENFLAMFSAIGQGILPFNGSKEEFGLLAGVVTIAIMVLWQRFRPAKLKLVPGALLGITAATVMVQLFHMPLKKVDVPANLLTVVDLPKLTTFASLDWASVISTAVAVAFIASAETLLSAAAVDKMQNRVKTDYDRELAAQGIGNMVCGFLGAPRMTGVIVRSSANVQAGAETRWSAVLHGIWILAFITLLPGVLRMVPICSLAAVLVYTGAKLVQVEHIRHLARFGRIPLVIYGVTLLTIIGRDLLTGVLVGVGLSLMNLIWKASHLSVQVVPLDRQDHYRLVLSGSATFLRIPQIAAALDRVPHGSIVHAEIDRLHHIDHACLDLLENWAAQHQEQGTEVRIEWDGLHRRYWQTSQEAA